MALTFFDALLEPHPLLRFSYKPPPGARFPRSGNTAVGCQIHHSFCGAWYAVHNASLPKLPSHYLIPPFQDLHPSSSILHLPPPLSRYCNLARARRYPTRPYPFGSGLLSGMCSCVFCSIGCDFLPRYISGEASSIFDNSNAKPQSFLGPSSISGEESSVLVRVFCGREWAGEAFDAAGHKEDEGGEKALVVSLQVNCPNPKPLNAPKLALAIYTVIFCCPQFAFIMIKMMTQL